MKYSEMDHAQQKLTRDYIDIRWKQLNTLVDNIGDRASKQLFYINGGGATAVLGYLGVVTAGKGPIHFEMKVSLCFFVAGLILAGCVTGFLFHGYRYLLDGWRSDTGRFFLGKMNYEDLNIEDEKRYQGESNEGIALIFSWTSFFFFIAGSFSTGIVMLCGQI